MRRVIAQCRVSVYETACIHMGWMRYFESKAGHQSWKLQTYNALPSNFILEELCSALPSCVISNFIEPQDHARKHAY